MTTRRSFLTTSSLAAAAAFGAPWRLHAARLVELGLIAPPPRRGVRVSDPDLKALAKRGLDAATAAGASYADVRFTVSRQRQFTEKVVDQREAQSPRDIEVVAVGVRALAGGPWGFAADTELTPEMMEWLGRTAAELGKASAWPSHHPIDLGLGERLPVAVGNWQMPVERDPFTVPDAEYIDLIQKIVDDVKGTENAYVNLRFNFERQERTFASTEGAFATQTVYNTFGGAAYNESSLVIGYREEKKRGSYMVPLVSPRGVGFEVFAREKMIDRIPEWIDRAVEAADAEKMEAPGRFDVVFDADTMAALVSTIGAATEVDRALGYEANAGGTSYLAPPEKMLGTIPFPTGVTVTANRTLAGGAATVKWDDEGVTPQDFPIIKDGKLIDYTTSREFVPKLAEWYKAHGQPVRSRGCLGAASALEVPLVQTPNLRLEPGAKDLSFEELLVGIEDGLAFRGGDLDPDQQQLNAMGGRNALVYRIKKGKLAGTVSSARYLVRIPNLWKDLVALGGERSAATRGFTVRKGQPAQASVHSVQAVAARFRNVAVHSVGGYGSETSG